MNTHEDPTPESVAQLANQVFSELHQTIISHESGSLDGNVESVHDMRVAIRRFRVALSNFAVCFPPKARKGLLVKLKNLADALGGVRDMDVMIAAMKTSLRTSSGGEESTISALIRRLRARRRSRLRVLRNYLRGEEYAGFKHEFSFEKLNEDLLAPANVQPEANETREVIHETIKEEHGQAA